MSSDIFKKNKRNTATVLLEELHSDIPSEDVLACASAGGTTFLLYKLPKDKRCELVEYRVTHIKGTDEIVFRRCGTYNDEDIRKITLPGRAIRIVPKKVEAAYTEYTKTLLKSGH